MKIKNKIQNKKKSGFTLLEVISVIALSILLISALLPKFNGYINKGKKFAVVTQCRKVVMAAECYEMESDKKLDTKTSVSSIKSDSGKEYLEEEKLDKLPDSMSLKECRDVVNGAEFNITDGVFSGIVDKKK